MEKSNPVLDMFQILTLTKRVDGTEQGISKLASMIEDLARETPGNKVGEAGFAKYEKYKKKCGDEVST